MPYETAWEFYFNEAQGVAWEVPLPGCLERDL